MTSPVLMREVATEQPTTHGMPYSRLTIAACVSEPPPSQTHAAMRANAGVQFGDVASHDEDLALLEIEELGRRQHHPGLPAVRCPPMPGSPTSESKMGRLFIRSK